MDDEKTSCSSEEVIVRIECDADAALIVNPETGSEWAFAGPKLRAKICASILSDSIATCVAENESGQVILRASRSFNAGELVFTETPFWFLHASKLSAKLKRCCSSAATVALQGIDMTEKQKLEFLFGFDSSIFFPAVAPRTNAQQLELLHGLWRPIKPPTIFDQAVRRGVEELDLLGCLPPSRLDDCGMNARDLAIAVIFAVQTNIFECSINEFGSNSNGPVLALCRIASRLNHSCRPSCWFYFEKGILCMRALVDISAGDELTHSYLERQRWSGLDDRRSALHHSKFFHCQCFRCIEEEAVVVEISKTMAQTGNLLAFKQTESVVSQWQTRTSIAASRLETAWAEAGLKDFEELSVALKGLLNALAVPAFTTEENVLKTRALVVAESKAVPILITAHELLYDFRKISRDFKGAAEISQSWLRIMRKTGFKRPANRTAWITEALADALAGWAGVPEELIFAPDFIDAVHRLTPKPVTHAFDRPKTAVVIDAFQDAIDELSLVYGVPRHLLTDICGANYSEDTRTKQEKVIFSIPSPQVAVLVSKAVLITRWLHSNRRYGD